MKFPLLNIDGTKSESIEISDKIVKLKVNHKLIKFVIDWQLNHAKPRTAKTKQRNQIKGSTVNCCTKRQWRRTSCKQKGPSICWWWRCSWTKRSCL